VRGRGKHPDSYSLCAFGEERTIEMKLHLGCGKRYLPGFIHIDLAEYDHIDYRHDVRTLPMFEDSTVDLIYASHVVEYFNRDEIMSVLQEWYRVLMKGGILRLSVPDFVALNKVYNKYKRLAPVRSILYGRWEIPGTNKIIYHKTVYDYDSLEVVLNETGFINIKRWDWEEAFADKYKGFDDFSQAYIPHMDKENGILISLNMEAEK